MNYNSDLFLYNDNSDHNSFSRTYSRANKLNFLKLVKTPAARVTKDLKRNFFSHNTNFSSKNFIKDDFIYGQKTLHTFDQGNRRKEIRFKTFNRKKEKEMLKHLNSLHKRITKEKLVHSKIYILLQKSAHEKYLKNKIEKEKQRQKNTFITTVNDERKIKEAMEENDNEENPTVVKTNELTRYSNNPKENSLTFNNYNNNILNLNTTNSNSSNKPLYLSLFDSNKKINVKNLKQTNLDSNINYNNRKVKMRVGDEGTPPLILFSENHPGVRTKKKEIDFSKLKPISLPCIKFNDTLDNYFKWVLQGTKNDTQILAKTCIAKLRFQIINNALIEHYKVSMEKKEYPVDLTNAMYYLYRKGQKFFLEFDDLYRKYLAFLSFEIKKNKNILSDLSDKSEKIFKENTILIKKIINVMGQKNVYESFKKLCLMVKYKTKNIDTIPLEEIRKYGMRLDHYEREEKFEEKIEERERPKSQKKTAKKILKHGLTYKRESKFKEKDSSKKNCSNLSVHKSLPFHQEEPVFESIDELYKKFDEDNQNLYKTYLKYNDNFHDKRKLEKEMINEINIDKSPETRYMKNFLEKLNRELISLKQKYKRLTIFKNMLLGKKISSDYFDDEKGTLTDNNNNNIVNQETQKQRFFIEENEDTVALYRIYLKVRSMLLNPEINIEKILKMRKVYTLIKEKKSIRDITFHGEVFSKEVLMIKFLELLCLKIMGWKERWLKNKKTRKAYLKIKLQREKELKINKCKQNLIEEQIHLMKRNEKIISKTNKIPFLDIKKVDPYFKRYIYEGIIKNEIKQREAEKRGHVESEADKYANLINY